MSNTNSILAMAIMIEQLTNITVDVFWDIVAKQFLKRRRATSSTKTNSKTNKSTSISSKKPSRSA